MKTFLYSTFFLLFIFSNSQAQLNYTFSATTAVYQPIAGGITPTLINRPYGANQFSFTYDEGFANDVPIGFTFNYNGYDYNTISINANGFATFTSFLTSTSIIESFYINRLNGGPNPDVNTPVIAPLWDDLDLQDNSNFRYLTTGSAGSRVFTVEWAKVLWQYDAAPSTLSFELKLYEGSNVIEFCYKDEGGAPSAAASASIGITDRHAYNDAFISLQGTSSSPQVSTSVENTSLSKKPADNQVYRFTPYPGNVPTALRWVTLTNTTADVGWTPANGVSDYEFAVTTSPTPPASGTIITGNIGSVTSLIPATQYYFYVRGVASANAKSIWLKDSFTTATNPAPLDYHEGFEELSNSTLSIPDSMRQQDFRDTSRYYYNNGINGFAGWYADLVPNTGGASMAYSAFGAYDADIWLFTPGFDMQAGVTYNLKFYYSVNANSGGNAVANLEVKFGTKAGAAGMDAGNLVTLNQFTNTTYKDSSIFFTPPASGVYYIGFHDFINKTGGQLELDDISLSATTLPVSLIDFTGESSGKLNLLHWSTVTEQNNTGFEIQRSEDGQNFSKIGFANSKAFNGNSNLKINYDYSDASYRSGNNYYRLKQVDKDGKFVYSNILVLRNGKDDAGITAIYPNPVKNTLNVKLTSASGDKLTITITDINGRTIINKTNSIGIGETIVPLDVSHYSTGTYFIKLTSSNGKEKAFSKFVKE